MTFQLSWWKSWPETTWTQGCSCSHALMPLVVHCWQINDAPWAMLVKLGRILISLFWKWKHISLIFIIHRTWIETYIIAPPDSSIVGTADPDTLAWSWTEPWLALDTIEVINALIDSRPLSSWKIAADNPVSLCQSGKEVWFLSLFHRTKLLELEVGVKFQDLIVDLLDGAVKMGGGLPFTVLDLPG